MRLVARKDGRTEELSVSVANGDGSTINYLVDCGWELSFSEGASSPEVPLSYVSDLLEPRDV